MKSPVPTIPARNILCQPASGQNMLGNTRSIKFSNLRACQKDLIAIGESTILNLDQAQASQNGHVRSIRLGASGAILLLPGSLKLSDTLEITLWIVIETKVSLVFVD